MKRGGQAQTMMNTNQVTMPVEETELTNLYE